jgi:hypothetical protein
MKLLWDKRCGKKRRGLWGKTSMQNMGWTKLHFNLEIKVQNEKFVMEVTFLKMCLDTLLY